MSCRPRNSPAIGRARKPSIRRWRTRLKGWRIFSSSPIVRTFGRPQTTLPRPPLEESKLAIRRPTRRVRPDRACHHFPPGDAGDPLPCRPSLFGLARDLRDPPIAELSRTCQLPVGHSRPRVLGRHAVLAPLCPSDDNRSSRNRDLPGRLPGAAPFETPLAHGYPDVADDGGPRSCRAHVPIDPPRIRGRSALLFLFVLQ